MWISSKQFYFLLTDFKNEMENKLFPLSGL